MAKIVRVVAHEEADTYTVPYVGNCVESETAPVEPSLPEPLALRNRGDSLALLPHSNDKKASPQETLRLNSGFLLPATAMVGNSLVFLFSLAATTYLSAGLVRLFPWSNMFVALIFLFLLTLFLPLTLFSWDWVKASINMMASGTEEVIVVPRWPGNASRAKNLICNVMLTYSAVCLVLASISFYRVFLSTSGTPGGNPLLGWFSIAIAIYCLAVYFDVKKANADQPETHP